MTFWPLRLFVFFSCTFLHQIRCFSWPSKALGRAGTGRFATSDNDDADKLLSKAELLRREIDDFEQRKRAEEEEEQRQIDEAKAEKQATRNRYSAVVPILKPDGNSQLERCDFKPRWQDGSSYITTIEANLPLGVILGESEQFAAATEVDEVGEDSNGFAAGLRVGDILHACTACKVEMEMPTWQLLAGGIGVPKTKTFMYQADGRPFEEIMEAIGSNRQDPENKPVLLVVERRD
uniref:PDZ domain-containing protein n=1 Tax=Entomoneis paludosa TaxID=265537 RepID=A0A7S2VE69_9STRA